MERSRGGGVGSGDISEEDEDDKFNNNNNKIEEELLQLDSTTTKSSSWKSRLGFLKNGVGAYSRPQQQGLFFHPHNWGYVLWTHFILIWAVYSSFFTPLEFGFFRGLPENLFLLDIAGQIAFLIDIIVRFFVAYRDHHSHRMIFNHNLIAIRYLKSRFLVDFLGCLPWDVIYRASGRKEVVRYLLWIRLSRALRVTELFEKLEKDIRINYLFTRIVKLFVVELYCTHTAACIFYYLATTLPPSQEGYTWIGSLKMGDYSYSQFREIDLWTRYITSLYFAIVTMATVGYGEIHAVNNREMIFIMIYVSLDMILGAYLLGNMAALIVKGSKTEKFRDKMSDLLEYMNRNKLGKKIINEIKGHVQLQYDSGYTEAAVLQDIPASFRAKISQKLYEPHIRGVPLFKGCSRGFTKQIASRVHEETFLTGEVIVEQGDIMDQFYIVCHGKLGKVSNLQNKILDSDITLHIGKHESELAMKLNCAAYYGDLYQLKRLIGAGADPSKTDYDGRSPLHLAASKGYEDIVQFLIQKEALVNIKDNYGNTPLFEAIKHGYDLVAYLLVESGASLDIVEAGNCLCMAVAGEDLGFLKRVITNGVNPNSKNYDLRTPLHLAASKGSYAMANLLLEAGASVFSKDRWGNTPLDEARVSGNKNLIQLLENAKQAQLSESSDCLKGCQDRQRKCTIFPFHPLDHKEERRLGVVLWVPSSIRELFETAKEQLKFSGASCILSEDGGKILDMGMICDDQKLFLVSDDSANLG